MTIAGAIMLAPFVCVHQLVRVERRAGPAEQQQVAGHQTAAIKPAHRPGMTPQYEAALVVGLGDLSLAVRGAARESDEP